MSHVYLKGFNSITELIYFTKNAELELNRQPNLLIISTTLGDALVYEQFGNEYDEECLRWKNLIGSTFMGLKVKVVSNKGYDYIELFEEEGVV